MSATNISPLFSPWNSASFASLYGRETPSLQQFSEFDDTEFDILTDEDRQIPKYIPRSISFGAGCSAKTPPVPSAIMHM